MPVPLDDRISEREGLWAGFRAGFRYAVPFALAGGLLALSFGVVSQDVGLSPAAAIVMSLIVYAGSAQFAALSILAGGGTVGAAIVAAGLMNSRFLPMGFALAPSLPGGPVKRAAQGQTVVDVSWVLAGREDGTFDRGVLFGSSALQYLTWTLGTVAGVVFGDVLGDPEKLGLDAIFPAFFVYLLISELRNRRAVGAAAIGAAIALVLVPFAPSGVPILAASAGAFIGLMRR